MRSIYLIAASCFLGGALVAQQPSLPAAPPTTSHSIRWEAVQRVQPGALVEFRDQQTAVHTECLVDHIDDVALTCQSDDPSLPEERVSYPGNSMDRVWVFRTRHESNRKWFYIATGAGAVLGAGLLSAAGVRGAILGLGLGAAVGGGSVAANSRDRIVTERRLIYAAH